jgi:WD40 repeat protein
LDWIGDATFVVGRWDGTISIFRIPKSGEFGPIVVQAMAGPSGHGIEMIITIDDRMIVSSDGSDRLAVWKRKSNTENFAPAESLAYDAQAGSANSATLLEVNGQLYLVTGHENGYILIWRQTSTKEFELANTVDVHSANPIPSPFILRNVRGLVVWRGDHVIAGSEDGDIVGLRVPDGREVFRVRYNQTAQRGINSLSLLGDWLLLANCSVGQTDKNIWLYDLSTGQPVLRDSKNLVLDTQRAQVFNFDAILFDVGGEFGFFSSTEEGLLWQGRIDDHQLAVTGVTKIAAEGGAILRWASGNSLLAAVAYQIWLFKMK